MSIRTVISQMVLVALTSCTPIKPVVSDIGTDKVRIQHIPLLGDPTFQQALKTEDPQSELNLQNEADRACGIYGRIATQPISTRCVEHDYYMGIRIESELNLQNEADRACGIYGRIATQPISTRCVEHDYYMGIRIGCLTEETLFACGPADGQD